MPKSEEKEPKAEKSPQELKGERIGKAPTQEEDASFHVYEFEDVPKSES